MVAHNTKGDRTSSGGKRRRKRPLSMVQFYKLATWVQGRGDRLTVDRPDFDRVANEAAKDLAFPVYARDVANACRATGIHWSPDLPPAGPNATASASTRRTRDRQIALIATAVRSIYAKFGEPLPTGFDDDLAPGVPHERNGRAA
jgi:hypothetical protein